MEDGSVFANFNIGFQENNRQQEEEKEALDADEAAPFCGAWRTDQFMDGSAFANLNICFEENS